MLMALERATRESLFNSNTHKSLEKTDPNQLLFKMIQKLLSELVNHSRNGSGWYFKEIIALEIHTVEYKLLKGFSYFPLLIF